MEEKGKSVGGIQLSSPENLIIPMVFWRVWQMCGDILAGVAIFFCNNQCPFIAVDKLIFHNLSLFAAQDFYCLLSPFDFVAFGLAFKGEKDAALFNKGQAVFGEYVQGGDRSCRGNIKTLSECFVLTRLLGSYVNCVRGELQFREHRFKEFKPLCGGIHKADFKVGAGYQQRNSGKTRSRTNINKAVALFNIHEFQKIQAVNKVLYGNALVVSNCRKVHFFVPFL